jgi:hypothetical protein
MVTVAPRLWAVGLLPARPCWAMARTAALRSRGAERELAIFLTVHAACEGGFQLNSDYALLPRREEKSACLQCPMLFRHADTERTKWGQGRSSALWTEPQILPQDVTVPRKQGTSLQERDQSCPQSWMLGSLWTWEVTEARLRGLSDGTVTPKHTQTNRTGTRPDCPLTTPHQHKKLLIL